MSKYRSPTHNYILHEQTPSPDPDESTPSSSVVPKKKRAENVAQPQAQRKKPDSGAPYQTPRRKTSDESEPQRRSATDQTPQRRTSEVSDRTSRRRHGGASDQSFRRRHEILPDQSLQYATHDLIKSLQAPTLNG